ncbi:hypothetical protein [Amycolatopsis sp. lyj-112]|uniref:hypothetical protein n=1 Tax=Amycolatopsis sp. lyj-112 TaxID=2789288 RepID=UPI00397D2781
MSTTSRTLCADSARPRAPDLKYAVLHLHAGVEVLLKYRLICQDWRPIEDTDDGAPEVTEKDYESGRFRSIGIGKALKRLQDLDGITLTNGPKIAAGALERFRNQLQHQGLTSSADAVESQTVRRLLRRDNAECVVISMPSRMPADPDQVPVDVGGVPTSRVGVHPLDRDVAVDGAQGDLQRWRDAGEQGGQSLAALLMRLGPRSRCFSASRSKATWQTPMPAGARGTRLSRLRWVKRDP